MPRPARFQIAGRIEHLLHARAAARPLVADDDDVARRDLAAQDPLHRVVLAFEDPRRAFELEAAGVDPRRLHDRAVERDVAVQHRKAAVPRESVLGIADDALGAILVERGIARRLAERDLGRHAAGPGEEELARRISGRAHDVVARQRMVEQLGMHHAHVTIKETRAIELAQNAHDPAGAVDVLDMHIRHGRGDLAQTRHAARQPVDIGHGEVDLALVRGGKQVQDSVGRTAHGDVERHGVFERLEGGDPARQRAFVALLVPAPREIDDEVAGLDEQAPPVGVSGHHRAVPRQRQAERLGEAVHRIGGEHARAGAAGRTGRTLEHRDVGVGHFAVRRGDHRVDEVDAARSRRELDLARFHRSAGNEHRGDVEAHRRHQHARRDLVAVRDAHQRIGAMGVGHIFDAVGDELARRQRVEHAVVAHGDAVVHGDGVEFLGDPARGLHLPRHQLAEVLEVHMTGHELGEGIGDGDDRLAEIAVLHAGCAPKAAGAGHIAAVGRSAGAIGRHG